MEQAGADDVPTRAEAAQRLGAKEDGTTARSHAYPVGVLRSIASVWIALQVELHGRYSFERLQRLKTYASTVSPIRVALAGLLSPVPTLLMITLMDCVPLAPPDAGIGANYVFWVRNYLTIVLITVAALQQFRTCLPDLPLSTRAMWVLTLCATNASVGLAFGLSFWIGFPLPFIMVMGTPIWAATLLTGSIYLWGHTLRQQRELVPQLFNFVFVFSCEVSMTLIYPMFIYIFNSLESTQQTMFVMLLPLIKLGIKNLISHFLQNMDDLKPEMVIFNVEIFNALYVSCCMQNATSPVTSAVIMTIDAVHAMLSIYDVNALLNELNRIHAKLPLAYSFKNTSFLDTALEILRIDPQVRNHPSFQRTIRSPSPHGTTRQLIFRQKTVVPTTLVLPQPTPTPRPSRQLKTNGSWALLSSGLAAITGSRQLKPVSTRVDDAHVLMQSLTPAERLRFVQKTLKVLFVSEFVLLVEYTEVVMPVVYCIYMFVVFHLPNRAYYSQVAQLSTAQLERTIRNVLAYSLLELLSLVVVSVVLKRKLRFSSLHQLAFVLDEQRTVVQAKIVLWTIYVVQSSLVHFGFDFSLKFAWLQRASP